MSHTPDLGLQTFASVGAPSAHTAGECGAPARALQGQQLALLNALTRRKVLLGTMYHGALIALQDPTNPDRLAQCAHSMRELMEKLPEHLDVPSPAHRESLKSKIFEIHPIFTGMKDSTACHKPPNIWEGLIDAKLQNLLRKLDAFFDWFVEHNPRRRLEVHGALRKMDGTGRSLPPKLADLNVQRWMDMREYYQGVSHHRNLTTLEEMEQWNDALERFLLDALVPRTFEDFAEIDALLNLGDSDAKP